MGPAKGVDAILKLSAARGDDDAMPSLGQRLREREDIAGDAADVEMRSDMENSHRLAGWRVGGLAGWPADRSSASASRPRTAPRTSSTPMRRMQAWVMVRQLVE